MEPVLFIHGIIIGIALAAPVGPIALICVRRTLANGRMHGIISGMGVATADIVYAAITAFGFALISEFLLARQWFFRLFGGIALIAVGIRIFLRVPTGNHRHRRISLRILRILHPCLPSRLQTR